MKLWIVRHAKSSWAQPAQTDFERPLNKRGNADGPRMAHWLAAQTDPAQWIWSSNAARALATADFVAAGFAAAATAQEPAIVADQRLYHPSVDSVTRVLQETPDDQTSVALVAHNPGLTHVINHLAGDWIIDNLPTFGVARFSVAGAWISLAPATTSLDWIVTPKTLP